VSADTKVKMFNCTFTSVLLYAAETWKVDKETTQKLQTFINKSLKKILKILKIYWLDKISNIVRQALEHQLLGKRKRGKLLNSWRRSVTREHEAISLSWTDIKTISKNRKEWKGTLIKIC
jgi:hypothetical protein